MIPIETIFGLFILAVICASSLQAQSGAGTIFDVQHLHRTSVLEGLAMGSNVPNDYEPWFDGKLTIADGRILFKDVKNQQFNAACSEINDLKLKKYDGERKYIHMSIQKHNWDFITFDNEHPIETIFSAIQSICTLR